MPMISDDFELIAKDGQPQYGAPLGALLSAHAAAIPDAPAITFPSHSATYSQIDQSANRRARLLADRYGVMPQDRVLITMSNRVEFLEAVFAVWKLGAIPCPVSHRMSELEFSDVAQLVDARCMIGTDALDVAPALVHNVDREDGVEYSAEPLVPISCSPGRIMNSGGSTGKPKLIVDPVPSTWGPEKAGRRCSARTNILVPAPLYHSAPFAYATMALAQGSHLVCLERFDPADWLDAVERFRPSFAYLVPTMMSRIAKLPAAVTAAADLSSIETLLHMAAPCPPAVKRWWIDRIGPEKVLEVYGGTERIGATVIDGAEWLAHPGSVGRASGGFEAVILSEDGVKLPPGEVGDIYFRSQGTDANYCYIGSKSRASGDLDTFGDMGWLNEDGWLYLADRRTDMVLIGGINVYPAEIEAALEMLPGVLNAAVVGLPDADMGSRLHAVIELAPEHEEPEDPLRFFAPAFSMLSKIKRPRSWDFTRDCIRDDTGKVRRFQLRAERIAGAAKG